MHNIAGIVTKDASMRSETMFGFHGMTMMTRIHGSSRKSTKSIVIETTDRSLLNKTASRGLMDQRTCRAIAADDIETANRTLSTGRGGMSDLSATSNTAGGTILLKTAVREMLDEVATHGAAFHGLSQSFSMASL